MEHKDRTFLKILMRDFIVKILLQLGLYKPVVELINRLKFAVQARRMRRDGLEMLRLAESTLREHGVCAFLTFGTLLGAYREHDFISYDPDVDLGVIASDSPKDIRLWMESAGFKFHRKNVVAGSEEVIEETYVYKNIHLDIFYYFDAGNEWYSVSPRRHESKEWKEANATDGFPCVRCYVPKCEFELSNFVGIPVYMPVDTDGWLRAMFSDSYMTPIKNWDETKYKTRIVAAQERSYRRYV